MSGHWLFTVIQMVQNMHNFELHHELAGQASLTGWVMGALIFALFIDYSIGEQND
jgi:hypothetical protein